MGRKFPESIRADRIVLLKMLGELRGGKLGNVAADDVDQLIGLLEKRLEGLESELRMAERRDPPHRD